MVTGVLYTRQTVVIMDTTVKTMAIMDIHAPTHLGKNDGYNGHTCTHNEKNGGYT
jgi:hypothetical protein